MKTCIDYYSLILSGAHNSTGVLGHTSNPELFLGLYILSTYLYFSLLLVGLLISQITIVLINTYGTQNMCIKYALLIVVLATNLN